jgi:preprotein translocase subunit SecA
VEGFNFDIRKHVLQYDEVVNEQRNRIYDQRRRILTEPSLKSSIEEMIEDEIDEIVESFTAGQYEDEWKLDELAHVLGGIFQLPHGFSVEPWKELKQDEIVEQAVDMALAAYAAKEQRLGEALLRNTEKQIMLWAVDNRWVRHLTDLDRLREGIGLQAFAQVDPLVAYKREAFAMYSELMNDIRGDIVKAVLTPPVQAESERVRQQTLARATTPIARNIRAHHGNGGDATPQTMRKSGPDLGRNDLCWCGSGKKYKHCHMKGDRATAEGGPRKPNGGQKTPAKPA